jgi:glutathione synthase/RimK-type ligase-like ATP-grasp enzyme
MFARIRTKNPSASSLRKSIPTKKRAVVRLGSLTPTARIFPTDRDVIEINTPEAIENSRSKLKMKECFKTKNISQADWLTFDNLDLDLPGDAFELPIVIKRVYGFKGRGMELIESLDEFTTWCRNHPNKSGWYIEKFHNYAREYRLHVAKDVGVFMSWRKLRKSEATERWFFNSSNCNWVSPDHELFDTPRCWDEMCKQAKNALEATGLDIGAVDIRVQSNEVKNPKFIVCEINSAPALGTMGIERYKDILTKLINNKYERDNNL